MKTICSLPIAFTAMLAMIPVTLAQTTKAPEGSSAPTSQKGPEKKPKQESPQGPTGPVETKSGGAPAARPEGDTPAGMQTMPKEPPDKGVPPKR